MNSLYRFIFFLFILFVLPNNIIAQSFKVVLDAGHGGKDTGTVGLKSFKNNYESKVVLKITQKIGKLLKKESDIKTIYTRTNNTFIELHKRGKIANKVDADLFISIHCDASSNKSAYGAATYVLGMGKTAKNLELAKRENDVILLEDDRERNYSYDPNSQEFIIGLTLMQEDYLDKSIEFAGIVQNKFASVAKRKNRGVQQANFAVLYDSYMPSVLIELGFLTNKAEERYLHSDAGQNKMAESIYKAIKTYKKRLENNSVGTFDDVEDVNEVQYIEDDTNTSTQPTTTSKKYYKIQVAASRRKIATKAYNFKGLDNIKRIKKGKVYLYYYGKTTNLEDARRLRTIVFNKGYKDSFIATFNSDNTNTQNTAVTQTPVKTTSTNSKTRIFDGIDFKVQTSSSLKKIETKAYNFKGLQNIERVKIGKHYKYYYGKTSDYNLIKKMHKEVVKKGFSGAFIVAIKNGQKVSVRQLIRGR